MPIPFVCRPAISVKRISSIKVEESQFQSDLLNAQASLLQNRVQLEALLGLPDSPQFDIDGTAVPPELGFTADDLNARALTNRPDYLAAVDSVHKAEADVKLADANGAIPTVSSRQSTNATVRIMASAFLAAPHPDF